MKVVLTLLLVAYVSSASVESKKDPSKCSLKDESTIGVCLRKGEFTKTNLFAKTYYLCINISYPDLPCNLGKWKMHSISGETVGQDSGYSWHQLTDKACIWEKGMIHGNLG